MANQVKKKILYTSHVANFQKFNRPFMRMMREKGWEVHYASMGEEEIKDADKAFKVPFTRSPFKLSNIKAYKQLKKIIDRENYDIIHTHTPMGSVVTRLAARDARKKGTKVIYTAHGFHFFKGAPLINWLIYYPVERYMARHTDTLITINQEDYQRAKSQFKNTHVEYVPGVGVDPKKFDIKMTKKERDAYRIKLGLNPKGKVAIYVAEINQNKNQLGMIKDIANDLGDFDLQILLVGKDSLGGKVQDYVKANHLENKVKFLGYRTDVPELLMISDIALSYSKREGLPVHVLEAVAADKQIVALGCRGLNEIALIPGNWLATNCNEFTGKFLDACRYTTNFNAQARDAIKVEILNQFGLKNVCNILKSIYAGVEGINI